MHRFLQSTASSGSGSPLIRPVLAPARAGELLGGVFSQDLVEHRPFAFAPAQDAAQALDVLADAAGAESTMPTLAAGTSTPSLSTLEVTRRDTRRN